MVAARAVLDGLKGSFDATCTTAPADYFVKTLASIRSITLAAVSVGFAATAAVGQQSPFADVEELCSQFNGDFEIVTEEFLARGWQKDHPNAESVLDLAFLTVLYRLDPEVQMSQEEFVKAFDGSKDSVLQELGFGLPNKLLLTYPAREDLSPLILSYENHQLSAIKSSFKTSCYLAGSITAESEWLDGLLVDGKLHQTFVNFDPVTHNFVGASLSGANIPDVKIEASGLLKYSRERVEPILPRPMPYDLYYSIISIYFRQG